MLLRAVSGWLPAIVLAGAVGVWAVAAGAQDPLKTLPNNYQKIFENQSVTVIRAHYGAHEKIPVHDHPGFATVFVYLSDSGPVRIDHMEPDGKTEPVLRPPTVSGSFRVVAGMAERHSIENLGDASSDFLRVELKRLDLKLAEPFRGNAPASLARDEDGVEFSNPALQVERIVCAGPALCPVKASVADSLLIAFAPVAFTPLDVEPGATAAPQRMEVGAVRWLPASQDARIGAQGNGAAHVLRILLPEPGK